MGTPASEVGKEIKSINSAELFDWFDGTGAEPAEMKQITSNLEAKFGAAISAVTLKNMQRVIALQETLIGLENEVYSELAISSMSSEDKVNAIGDINKMIINTLEFTRKFASQNRDLFKSHSDKVDGVAALLKSLPQDRLDALKEKIEKGEI